MDTTKPNALTAQHKQAYLEDGYVVIPGLFSQAETAAYRAHYMLLRRSGKYAGDFAGEGADEADPLRRYPRMIHMHRWDDVSLRWLLDERLRVCLTELAGHEPYAVQTMLYFKPAGARGQALHQDNFYLRVKPSTCLAAWMALDPCTVENGCIQVVPGSHTWPMLCTEKADIRVSFSDVTVPLPPGQEIRPVLMHPGDVLFFNGSLVHGSYPNTTRDQFRRALIGHYIEGDAVQVAEFYHPVLRMDGSVLEIDKSAGGGACGVWVDRSGAPAIELSGDEVRYRKHE
jgi:ectoine hydroxylase-related dioxygenase (phytanoyl-CoA dioxygenase family)